MKTPWIIFAAAAVASGQPVDYARQIQPILAAKCLACHSQEKRSGGFSLATYEDALEGGRSGAAIRPGNSPASLMLHRITGQTEPRMPIGGPGLTTAEIALIRSWIDHGARQTPTSPAAKPKWEPPLGLERPAVPPVVWKTWNAPLDRFVAAYLAARGASEPQLVSDALFARRAYLDVWGLLPSPDELQTFLNDRRPNKRSLLVAKLLADSQKYAEHWISFWNDLLRNDDGVSYFSDAQGGSRQSITKWLFDALQSNLPYDQFVAKLLNPAAPGDPTGFLIGVNWRGEINASQTPAMQASQNTAQIFLGINFKCNSCHDSFINKWKLKDAYSLAGFFSTEPKLQMYRCDVAQANQFAGPAFMFPELNRAPASDSMADRRAAAAAIFTDPRNGRLPRTLVNRVWQGLFGRGIVANPDEMDGEPWSPELLDWLAADFVEHRYDMKHLIGAILSSRAYQMPAVVRQSPPAERNYAFHGPEIRRITAEQFADAIGSITGEWSVYQAPPPGQGVPPPAPVYARNWRASSNNLTRALGRPIRDQVISVRSSQASTLQALELVNGEFLTHWLSVGARKLTGRLAPEPQSLLNRAVAGRNARSSAFDIDISQSSRLWLLVVEQGSNSPEKLDPIWAKAELVGPTGVTPLSALKPEDASGLRGGETDGVRVKNPSRLVLDIAGKGFTRFRGTVGLENKISDIGATLNPAIRFFVFGAEPNMDRLVPLGPGSPMPPPPVLTHDEAVDRVFRYALGRAPSSAERGAATGADLADVLWAVLMKPEFQLIY